jgi:hypothetical protein
MYYVAQGGRERERVNHVGFITHEKKKERKK